MFLNTYKTHTHPTWSQSCFPGLHFCSSPAWAGGRANVGVIFVMGSMRPHSCSTMAGIRAPRSRHFSLCPETWPRTEGRVSAFSLANTIQHEPSPDWMRPTHIMEGNLLYSDYRVTDYSWWSQLKDAFTATCMPVFSQTSGHHSPAKSAHRTNHHTVCSPTTVQGNRAHFTRSDYL